MTTHEPVDKHEQQPTVIGGDNIQVGDIQGSQVVAIGQGATAVYQQGLTIEEVAALVVELKHKDQPTVWDGRYPYLGLTAFREKDAQFFFGRESLVDDLLERVQQSNFIVIAGPSGSGKSSVARAGLFHALRDDRIETSDSWLLATMQPKGNPIEKCAAAIGRLAKSPTASDYIRDNAPTNSLALHQQIETLLTDDPRQRCVLLVDQFEETFTQTKDERVRSAFIEMLTETAVAENGRTIIILSLRADFVSHCARYPKLRSLMSQQFQLVGAMEPSDLAKAITLPALEVGAEIDPALVSRIMADMKGEPGALPLMSFALRDLFESEKSQQGQPMAMTLPKYVERGGIEDALQRHANKVFAQFSDEQKRIAENIFSKLIEIGQGRVDTRRTATFAELVPTHTDETRVAEVVSQLAHEGVRLITTNTEAENTVTDTPATTVTIAHEKLIDAWPWLRRLVDENRELIALQNQITSDAKTWAKEEDTGFLYSGGRLLQIEEKLENLQSNLDDLSQRFLQASLAEQQRREDEETANRRKDEELRSQKRVGRILRWATAVVGLLLVVAVILAFQANNSASLAATREVEAIAAQATSAVNADLAATAEAAALVSAQEAVTAQAEAERLGKINQIPSLAASTWSLREQSHVNDELTVLLSLEAVWLNSRYRAPFTVQADEGLRQALSQPFFSTVLSGHEYWVRAVAYSPDGQQLATASFGEVRLWNLRDLSAEPIVLSSPNRSITAVAYSLDGQQLATGSSREVRLWNLRDLSAEPIALSGHEDFVSSVAYSPDGQQLATGSQDRTVRLWNLGDLSAEPIALSGHEDFVSSVAYSPDGQQLATGSQDRTVRLWNLGDLSAEPIVLSGHEVSVSSVAYSPDGQQLATGSSYRTVRLWDLGDLSAEPIVLSGYQEGVSSVVYSPDGQQLAMGSQDRTVRLWDLSDLSAEPIVLSGHEGSVLSVAYSPDGQQLATGSSDNAVRLWNISDPPAEPIILSEHEGSILSVAYSPDGQQLAIGSFDSTVRLWNVSDLRAKLIVLREHQDWVWSVVYSPDGQQLATGSQDSTVRLWDLSNLSTEPIVLSGYEEGILSVAYSPDGQQLATGSLGTVKLWDLSDLSADPIVLNRHEDWVGAVAYSPDGQQLATGSSDRTVRLWDLSDLSAEPIVLSGHQGSVRSVAYSPDGQQLATGSEDWTVRLWDLSDLSTEPIVLSRYEGSVYSVAYSPNGQQLATGSEDWTVRLWDLSDLSTEPIVLSRYEASVLSVAYSPDGQQLATGSSDNKVWLWPGTNRLPFMGCSQIRRNLTWSEWQRYLPLEPLYHLTCPNLPVHPSLAQAMVTWPQAQQQEQLESLRQQSPAAAAQLEQLLAEQE